MKRTIILFVCILALSFCLFGCSKSQQSQDEDPVYITVNGKVLKATVSKSKNTDEIIIWAPKIVELARLFHLTVDADPFDLGDCREFTVGATEDTEKMTAVLSYFIWDNPEPSESELEMRSLLEGFGLSSDNRLTAQWVTENIDLAAETLPIFRQTRFQAILLIVQNHIDECYEQYVLGNTNE